jgi:hypothetical protein
MEPLPQAANPAARYERHRPEAPLLYQLVEEHYPAFLAALSVSDRSLRCAGRRLGAGRGPSA